MGLRLLIADRVTVTVAQLGTALNGLLHFRPALLGGEEVGEDVEFGGGGSTRAYDEESHLV